MYGNVKSSNNSSDAQAKEKLNLFVYEYLNHIGASRAAQGFCADMKWNPTRMTLGEPPGFLFNWWCVFWDLYSAAPENRDHHSHSDDAQAFHDSGLANNANFVAVQSNPSPMQQTQARHDSTSPYFSPPTVHLTRSQFGRYSKLRTTGQIIPQLPSRYDYTMHLPVEPALNYNSSSVSPNMCLSHTSNLSSHLYHPYLTASSSSISHQIKPGTMTMPNSQGSIPHSMKISEFFSMDPQNYDTPLYSPYSSISGIHVEPTPIQYTPYHQQIAADGSYHGDFDEQTESSTISPTITARQESWNSDYLTYPNNETHLIGKFK